MAQKASGLCTIFARTAEYRALKKSMLDDLESRGLLRQPYTDLVESYMRLWCQERLLDADIAKRGVYIEYQNGANQKGTTDNKSIEKLIRTTAQKANLWAALGFKEMAANAKPPEGDEDDEL